MTKVFASVLAYICAVLFSLNALAQNDSNDVVTMSSGWWGTSIDEFTKKAGLKPGEYSLLDHPMEKDVKVITVRNKPVVRWEPKQFREYQIRFRDKTGLFEVGGFIEGTPDEVFEALKNRYGLPARGSQAMGMKAYGWDIGKSTLDLRYNIYELTPRK